MCIYQIARPLEVRSRRRCHCRRDAACVSRSAHAGATVSAGAARRGRRRRAVRRRALGSSTPRPTSACASRTSAQAARCASTRAARRCAAPTSAPATIEYRHRASRPERAVPGVHFAAARPATWRVLLAAPAQERRLGLEPVHAGDRRRARPGRSTPAPASAAPRPTSSAPGTASASSSTRPAPTSSSTACARCASRELKSASTHGFLAVDSAAGAGNTTGQVYYANFRYRSAPERAARRHAGARRSPSMPGLIRRWQVSEALADDDAGAARRRDGLGRAALDERCRSSATASPTSPARRRAPGRKRFAIARFEVASERAATKMLRLGYSDIARVYVNGALLYRGDNSQYSRDPAFSASSACTRRSPCRCASGAQRHRLRRRGEQRRLGRRSAVRRSGRSRRRRAFEATP